MLILMRNRETKHPQKQRETSPHLGARSDPGIEFGNKHSKQTYTYIHFFVFHVLIYFDYVTMLMFCGFEAQSWKCGPLGGWASARATASSFATSAAHPASTPISGGNGRDSRVFKNKKGKQHICFLCTKYQNLGSFRQSQRHVDQRYLQYHRQIFGV